MYKELKQYVIPILFPSLFTPLALVLPRWGQDRGLALRDLMEAAKGNQFTWTVVAAFSFWALVWLKVPSKRVKGLTTNFGQTPVYQANGVTYYVVSLLALFMILAVNPNLAVKIYKNTPELIGSLNIVALILCLLLTLKGVFFPKYKEVTEAPPEPLFNFLYKFWCGSELHPEIFGIDIKQLTNCRIGMMGWQLLIVIYFVSSSMIHGFNLPLFLNTLLQSVYILKFFYWEAGYFFTLDITEDRASYYLCWGCLVYVPSFYTWSTYYLAGHLPLMGILASICLALVGLLAIILNYLVDYEKMWFRASGTSFFTTKPSYLEAKYVDETGTKRQSKLLTSGFWGTARHLNYTFELLLAFSWCSMGWTQGAAPFFYFVFLFVLLVHRLYRDDRKCTQKYGEAWLAYKKKVPYKLIPYVF